MGICLKNSVKVFLNSICETKEGKKKVRKYERKEKLLGRRTVLSLYILHLRGYETNLNKGKFY